MNRETWNRLKDRLEHYLSISEVASPPSAATSIRLINFIKADIKDLEQCFEAKEAERKRYYKELEDQRGAE